MLAIQMHVSTPNYVTYLWKPNIGIKDILLVILLFAIILTFRL